jgi:hypothetical protein
VCAKEGQERRTVRERLNSMWFTGTDVAQVTSIKRHHSPHRFKNQTSLKTLENQGVIDTVRFEHMPLLENKARNLQLILFDQRLGSSACQLFSQRPCRYDFSECGVLLSHDFQYLG